MDSQLVETEVFDYRERLYTRTEFENLLKSAGFKKVIVTTAYGNLSEVTENDSMVFVCH